MATSFNDMSVLAASTAFQSRVKMATTLYCTVVGSEAWTVPFHRERQTFASAILNSPDVYAPMFSYVAAVNTVVLNQATSTGTIVLTSTNVSTAQAAVQDNDLSNAIAAQFNSFFRVPAN